MTRPQLVVIPCGGSKLEHAAPAWQLYVGGYFRANLRYARALTGGADDRVRVLSALHGLVELHRVLDPYDLRMTSPFAVGVDVLRVQAADQVVTLEPARSAMRSNESRTASWRVWTPAVRVPLLELSDVVVLGGAAYRRAALAVWPDARTPMAGVGGIGHQLAALKRAADQLEQVTA